MIVVAMRPSGHIHLSGRDSHASQHGHQEGRLLSAAAASGTINGKRRLGALIAGLVGSLGSAPVIDREHRLRLIQPQNQRRYLLLKKGTAVHDFLRIDPIPGHVVQINFLRKGTAARFLFPQGSGMGRVTVKQIEVIGKGI